MALLAALLCVAPVLAAGGDHAVPPPASPHYPAQEEETAYWRAAAQARLTAELAAPDTNMPAKNVIIFLGDGMGVSTQVTPIYLMMFELSRPAIPLTRRRRGWWRGSGRGWRADQEMVGTRGAEQHATAVYSRAVRTRTGGRAGRSWPGSGSTI